MCELFLKKGSLSGRTFELTEFKFARSLNPDGAGFIHLKPNPETKRYEIVDMKTFPAAHVTSEEKKNNVSNGFKPISEWGDWRDNYDGDLGRYKRTQLLPETTFHPTPVIEGFRTKKVFESEEDYNLSFFEHKNGEPMYKLKTGEVDMVAEEIYNASMAVEIDDLFIAHFRYSTHGILVESNTQPILEGNYVVAHNGQFGFTKGEIGEDVSDTRHFTRLLEKKRKEAAIKLPKDANRERKMIKKLLDLAGGYYSVFIYSIVTMELYYFKSASKASFFIDGSGYLGATKEYRFPPYYSTSKNEISFRPSEKRRVLVTS